MIKRIVIVTAKTELDLSIFNNENNYIIGVERGCLDLIEKGIKIDYAISDFDKVINEELELIKQNATKIEILNPQKDLLDGEIAILKAKEISSNAEIIFITNPTKRFDKNFSIFGLIFKYNIKVINDDSSIFKIEKGTTELDFNNFQNKTYISFFSKENAIITLKDLAYSVENIELEPFDNKCISNSFIPYKNPKITTTQDLICITTR